MWKTIKYIFVKGHVGIPQNEACDAKAKFEAQRCTESIAEEAVKEFGEIRLHGQVVESRKELARDPKWMEGYHLGIMSCCRSRMAKRVQLGIERWKGNESVFVESPLPEPCRWCKGRHELTFYAFIENCPQARNFRKEVKERWAAVLRGESFDTELLFGKVRKSLFLRVCRKGVDEKEACKEFRRALTWWERRIQTLRQTLDTDEESESTEDEEKAENKEKTLAQSVRIMDVGLVERGEPEILVTRKGKKELKQFLSKEK